LALFSLSAAFFVIALVSLAVIVKNANREAVRRLQVKATGLGAILFITLYFYPTFPSSGQWVAIANIFAGIMVLLAPVLVIKKDLLPMQLPVYDDVLDWLFAIIHKTPHVENERKVRGIIKRCAVWIALFIGVAAGMLLILFEFSMEGAPNAKAFLKVVAVYVGFEACVIVLCFVLFNRFLGIIKKD
jgi:hypothetical protein